VVTGEAGERIQAWRQRHDAYEAARIPPHTTPCYWATAFDLDALGRQVTHAFPKTIDLRLGEVREFGGEQGTFYVELLDTARLDAARLRLYDGTHLDMGAFTPWPWHITCVRDTRGRDVDALRTAAAGLNPGDQWRLERIACLELRGSRYEPVACWDLR
jgi:hypothetical protein